ncbi:ImmA/IrrE family metallo-endopeptidase [Shewanella fodinae]|uniref:Uncharacterized protein DUF955 n=1 Tax=Shewanella fodinae TaxID=552357 RepID=A0A4R2FKQ3_9GAMM|nr:ImmA/IrrE family metallo-endopeptidase [Shewanella fodinae]TCN88826.1 uncharacterized protein DUF955 [Shewanella fodinae]
MIKRELAIVSAQRKLYQNPYAFLSESDDGQEIFEAEYIYLAKERKPILKELFSFQDNGSYSDTEIEQIALNVQRALWRNRKYLSNKTDIVIPIDILAPEIAIREMGYEYTLESSLGQYVEDGKEFEVAGLVDVERNQISLSQVFPPDVMYFTAAHELGHTILHPGLSLHRDRPVTGSEKRRSSKEREADKFATFFLMPKKQVLEAFTERFFTNEFILDETNSFYLGKTCNFSKIRDLSLMLASTSSFAGESFIPLSRYFHVSDSAMAIRLEELGVIKL